MQTFLVYSDLMEAPQHVLGWAFLLAIPLILILGGRSKSIPLHVLLLAWALRATFCIYNTYVNTMEVDDFEGLAYENSQYGLQYISNGLLSGVDIYTTFCSAVYVVFGRSPLLLEAINILLGVLTVANCYKIADLVFGPQVARLASLIMSLLPSSVIFGTTILRESFWVYLVSIGAFWWLQGLQKARPVLVLISFAPFALAYSLHGGALGLILAWCATPVLSLSGIRQGKRRHIIAGILGLGIISAVVAVGSRSSLTQSLNSKFDVRNVNVEHIGATLESAARERAAYLPNTSLTASPALIWQLPLRLVYFVGMPFPWYIRNVTDVFGCIDGLFFFSALFYSFKLRKVALRNPALAACIIACFISYSIFAMGTSNYGTAVRHRAKLAPIACTLACGGWWWTRARKKRQDQVLPGNLPPLRWRMRPIRDAQR